eukprot:363471-Chlamydomonas_euryale.AAC.5
MCGSVRVHPQICRRPPVEYLLITASVTFLPLLETRCTIDILMYTNPIDSVPEEWEDSDPRNIQNAEIVSLRGFSTKVRRVHGVKTMVAYKQQSDEVV